MGNRKKFKKVPFTTKKAVIAWKYNLLANRYNELAEQYNELAEKVKKVAQLDLFAEKMKNGLYDFIVGINEAVDKSDKDELIGFIGENFENAFKDSMQKLLSNISFSKNFETNVISYIDKMSQEEISELISPTIETLMKNSCNGMEYLIRSTIRKAIEEKVVENIDNSIDNSLETNITQKVNDVIDDEKVEQMIKDAVYNSFKYTRFNLTDDPYYKELVTNILHSLEISKKDSEEINSLIKQGVKEAVQQTIIPLNDDKSKRYGSYNYNVYNFVYAAIHNEIYNILREYHIGESFYENLKYEVFSLSKEIALETDYKKFCTEMEGRSDIVKFDYYVKKSVDKPYKVFEIYETKGGEVYTRSGNIGTDYKEERRVGSYYSLTSNKRWKNGYVLIGETPYFERNYIEYLRRKKELENEKDCSIELSDKE